jgi:hypothetical protein
LNEQSRSKESPPIKVWFVERVFTMYRRLAIVGWSIGMTSWTVHQTCRLAYVGYKKGNNNKWTYDHADHLMVDLETIIALAFMTYIANLDAYECHPGDKNFLNDFIDECWVLHYTYDTGGLLFKSIFAYLLLMTIYKCNSFMCTFCLLYLYL